MKISKQIKELSEELMLFDDVMDKYEYIIELGRGLHILDEKYKTKSNLVQGCQSQLWLREYKKEGKLYFEADSDAFIVKGLVQILIRIYSDHKSQEILQVDRSELKELNLNEIISSGRQSGIVSMLQRIYSFARKDYDRQ